MKCTLTPRKGLSLGISVLNFVGVLIVAIVVIQFHTISPYNRTTADLGDNNTPGKDELQDIRTLLERTKAATIASIVVVVVAFLLDTGSTLCFGGGVDESDVAAMPRL